METLRALEEALLSFTGCALVISHDRWFLDKIATHILAFEDNGVISYFTGNYTDYDAKRLQQLGFEGKQSEKRSKYKKLEH